MSKAEELRRSRPTRLVSSASAIWSWQFRIILVGDSTVGKSALLKRFTEGSFAETSDPTVSIFLIVIGVGVFHLYRRGGRARGILTRENEN